jgi:RNA polymerase sigma-70 factor (ECF subfamily)
LPSSSVEVWSEVRRLPHRQAQSIALYYIAGLTMPEIAETLGISKDTVNTHLRRGRSTLARRLGVGEEHT